ncbi:MAG: transcription termination factor NusA [Chlamydiae bacterium]|nr:transcription termination factor NusA [Chlamydiota bacterium]
MNGELLAVFEYLERERGISRDVLIEAVESSLLSAARKGVEQAKNLRVEIDRETGAVRAFAEMRVVETVSSKDEEITLEEARKTDPEAKIGDSVSVEILTKNLGRIAAQSAKQVIIQRIREAENKIVYNEYKDRVGDIITAVVRRYERGNVILDLGKTEAVLPAKEQCPRESYGLGRRYKVYVAEVREGAKGPEIIVSRSHDELLRKLFELEVPEIGEGSVQIRGIARDPGYRAKMAVSSASDKVDPVGACVGMRGARVKDVVHELNGERVDIIRWNEDPVVFLTNALRPARPREIRIVAEGRAEIIVDDDQFALAVGKKGQGIRLVSKLTGWNVDIKKAGDIAREEQEAEVPVRDLGGLAPKVVAALEEHGYTTVGALRKADIKKLLEIPGIGDKTAQKIVHAAAEFRFPEPEPAPVEPATGPADEGAAAESTGGDAVSAPAAEESADGEPPAEGGAERPAEGIQEEGARQGAAVPDETELTDASAPAESGEAAGDGGPADKAGEDASNERGVSDAG